MNMSSVAENKVVDSCKRSIVMATNCRIAEQADLVVHKQNVSDTFY